MLEADIPREISFELPEGVFEAVITVVKPFKKQTGKGSQDWIRILFDVNVPEMQNFDCRAGRNFLVNLKSGSDLRNWLAELLGGEFFRSRSGRTIDLQQIEGMKCMVELEHIHGGGDYEKPLVVVSRIFPRLVRECGGRD